MLARDLGLELPRRKPVGLPRINPQHPLARGLTFATLLTGDGRPRDLVLGRTATGAPTVTRNTPQGQALRFNGTSDAANFGDISTYRTGSQNFTLVVYANPAAGGATLGLLSKRNSSTFQQVSFAANMDDHGGPASGLLGLFVYDGSNQLSGCATSSPINGQFHQFVGQRTSSTTLALYVDGVAQTIIYTAQNNVNYAGTEPMFVGAMGGTSAPSGGYLDGTIGYAYIWRGRVLTPSELAWLYRDPFCFVREAPRQEPWFSIWIPGAAGGATVNPNAIATGEVVYAPTVTMPSPQTINPNTIATAAAVPSVTVTLQVQPNAIATTESVFAPTVTQPVIQTVVPNAIASGETVYVLSVTLAGGAQSVMPSAIATGEQLYTPTVRQQILPDTIATAQQVFAPVVALVIPQTIQPGTIATAIAVYDPLVAFTVPAVQPNAIPSAAAVYAPAIIVAPRSPALPLAPSYDVFSAPVLVRSAAPMAPVLTGATTANAPALVSVA